MSRLTLTLFGSPRITLDGSTLHIQRRKAVALLAYLAVTQTPHRRDALATLFWPDYDQTGARDNLRRTLSSLHQALHQDWLEIDRNTIRLRDSADLWVDVVDFQTLLADCQRHPHPSDQTCDECLPLLSEAAQRYTGDFLTGFTLADSPGFDEWQAFETERLRLALAGALARLGEAYHARAEYATAIDHARRWVALDLLHEPAHRQLMQLYAQAGQQTAALRQYERCCELLNEELGVPPAPETTLLYEQIRKRTMAPVVIAAAQPPPALPPSFVRSPRHNLPTQTSPFIGREQELADIRRLLDEPDCRLLNLFGPGGIGKTRLALTLAAQSLDAFADGVFFVSLAPVSEAAYIAPAIAEALRFTFYGQSDPKTQLLAYLGQKRLMLIVDNMEHLLAGADLLSDIVSQAPGVTLLTTSRERLHLQDEWVYEVQGLPFPAADSEAAANVNAYPAVRLFLQRARQSRATFVPSTDEMADIARICRLVEGMPLGLELAAPWIRSLSCREIAAEIERSLDFLTTPLRNAPERHRSLRVVCEQTWGRLSPAEQAVLMRLSVFRGGCTREAAEAVAGATLPLLSALVDKALVRRTNLGRYDLHELIRQFAEAQLQAEPQVAEQVQQRHRDFYISFLEAHTADVKGRGQLETLAKIEADIDNVRIAWRGVIANRELEAIGRAAECLFVYHLYRNGYDEGLVEFGRAMAVFTALPDAQVDDGWLPELAIPDQHHNLVGFLLAAQGYFLAHRHALRRGQLLLEQALALLRRKVPGDRRKEAFALLWLGWALYFQDRITEARPYAQESLTLFAESADRWGEGWSLLLLSNCTRDGRPAEAEQILKKARSTCQESGDRSLLGYCCFNLGVVARELGHYAQAQQYVDEGVRISEELDNILGLGYALFRRGQLEIALGKYSQAIQTLQQSLAHFNEVGAVHASRARFTLGIAQHLKGEHDHAAHLYTQSLEAFAVADSKLWLTRCLNYLGRLAHDQGKLHQAERFQQEGLVLLQKTEQEPALVAATLRDLGQVMVASGEHRHAEARETFRQALELAIKHQLAPIALDVFVGVARLRVLAGATEPAIDLLALAAQHEASTFETRKRASQFLAEQFGHLRPEASQPSQAHGVQLDWQQAARQLVEELRMAEPATGLSPGRQLLPRHNLPTQTTLFIGREHELTDLGRLLADPAIRLVTILAPGGMGKTRLALAAAKNHLEASQDRVCFVELAPLTTGEEIVAAIANAAGYPFQQDERSLDRQLLDYLRERQFLLVLDNFEHLLEQAELVNHILQIAPKVKVLTTSRERLQLSGETVFALAGLEFPDRTTPEPALDYNAIKLFLQNAQRVRPDFAFGADDLTDMARICRLVQGMPLAIMLAAAWVDLLSLREIADEISQSLDFLATEWRDVPDRQRSIRAVFEHAWRRLSEAERTVFMKLAVFRGGFTRAAAQLVAGASLKLLSSLANKSLLQRQDSGRYTVHELLRQYAEVELAATGQTETTRAAHGAYFADFLQQREADLKGRRQKAAADEIEADFENVRSAWNWASERTQVELLGQATNSLGLVYEWFGRYQEGEAAFTRAADKLAEIESGQRQRILVNILIWQARFGAVLGRHKSARQLLSQSLTLIETSALAAQDTRAERAAVLMHLGKVAQRLGNHHEAKGLYEQSLALHRAIGDRWGEARTLLSLQNADGYRLEVGDPKQFQQQAEAAKQLILQSLAISRELGDQTTLAEGIRALGITHVMLGQMIEAQVAFEECVAICKDLGLVKSTLSILAMGSLGIAKAYLGLYKQMGTLGESTLTLAREVGDSQGIDLGLYLTGCAAVAEGSYPRAQQLLQEAVALCRNERISNLAFRLACLGYATYGRGNLIEARQQLIEALQIALEQRSTRATPYGLLLAAWLLAGQGEVERAVELMTLAQCFPFIANSRWCEDVAGRHIAAAAATLPPHVMAIAQARGRVRDLWATVEEVLTLFAVDEPAVVANEF